MVTELSHISEQADDPMSGSEWHESVDASAYGFESSVVASIDDDRVILSSEYTRSPCFRDEYIGMLFYLILIYLE